MDTDFIFDDKLNFNDKLKRVLDFQLGNQPVYAKFVKELENHTLVSFTKSEMPLLPIEAFKRTKISTNATYELLFLSSGTSGMERSKHYVADSSIYRTSILKGMGQFFTIDEYVILGYTPGYADNPNSSLIWMIQELIKNSSDENARFLSLNEPIPSDLLAKIEASNKKVMLFGAAFGLLDMVENFSIKLPFGSVIIETGGMKTHRREMERNELHNRLIEGFGISKEHIFSEYGMTELLSQAWAGSDGLFATPPWMHVSIRNPQNPLEEIPDGESGLIGIIDLANVYSCSFILTGDKGRKVGSKFTVEGRYFAENLRGCNFLIDVD